jgi:hypothetical protein
MNELHAETGLILAITLMTVICRDLGVDQDVVLRRLRTMGSVQATDGQTALADSIRKLADALETAMPGSP